MTGPSAVSTGTAAVPVRACGSPYSPLLFYSFKSEYLILGTSCGTLSTSVLILIMIRHLRWLQMWPCWKRPRNCFIVSSPGQSLASLPVSVCWQSFNRSSEHQVGLKPFLNTIQFTLAACQSLTYSKLISYHQV